jgi:hypothetical protein
MAIITEDYRTNDTIKLGLEVVNAASDDGIIYPITWTGFDTLDTDYDIVMENGESYNVASGITLEPLTKSLVWSLDTSPYNEGVTTGYIISNSRISGVYFFANIELTIYDKGIT